MTSVAVGAPSATHPIQFKEKKNREQKRRAVELKIVRERGNMRTKTRSSYSLDSSSTSILFGSISRRLVWENECKAGVGDARDKEDMVVGGKEVLRYHRHFNDNRHST